MNSFVGRVFGDYRIESLIGRGNLGDTFRAQNVRTGQIAVVKVLHPRLTGDGKFPARFRQIVGAAQGLKHPNVVPIEAFGGDGGAFYVAMEFFPEGSLRTLLQQRTERLPVARAVGIVRQAADALSFAHAKGVIHRDVKPENVLVSRTNATADVAKIADFGFTRLSEGGLTMGGNDVFGSLPYMSPEQSRWASVDARTDIYSLGVVLYEAVTGLVPFQVKTLKDAMEKHISAAPPPPRSVAPQLSVELESIILHCLAKRPEDRFASANELSLALARLGLEAWPEVRLGESEPAPRSRPAPGPPPIVRLRDDKPIATPGVKADAPSAVSTPPQRKSYFVKLDPKEASALGPSAPIAPQSVDLPVAPAPPRVENKDNKQNKPINVIVNQERGPRPSALPPDDDKPQPAGVASVQSRRIRVALDKETLALTPGIPMVLPVSVVNAGSRVDFLTVTVEGVPEKWIEVPPAPPQLTPNAGATVPVKILVPKSSKSRAGDYTATVRARSHYDPSESSTAIGRWIVLPFAAASLDVSPSRVRGWRTAKVQATLANEGNAPLRFAVGARDDERALRYAIAEREVMLEPGERKALTVGVKGPFRFIGSTETRPFSVLASPITGTAPLSAVTPQNAQAQFIQRALVPTFVPPVLLALAIALYALWPRPTPSQLKVTPASAVVAVGDSTPLVASVTNAKNEVLPNQGVQWASRDSTIAHVMPSGIVHARREGRTTIIAQQGRTISEVAIEIVAAKPAAIAINPTKLRLKVGESSVIGNTITDAAGRTMQSAIMWISSDPSVATVGANGRVVGKGAGLATVTAQIGEKQASAEVRVDSVPKPVVAAAPAAPAGPVEDCQDYDPATLAIANRPGPGWMLTDGSKTVLLTLDNQEDSQRALLLARRYKAHCFYGRQNKRPNRSDYVREYWKTPTGIPTQIDREDCTSYDPTAVSIMDRGAEGFAVVSSAGKLYLLTDTRADAQNVWDLARHSSAHCLIGGKNRRENKRDFTVEYWR
jgi:serine/threonine protein kinase